MQNVKRNIIIARALVFALGVVSCENYQQTKNPVSDDRDSLFQQERLVKFNSIVYPRMLQQVKTGDIITRCGIDLTSDMLRRLNEKDQTYSHIGIASIENDTVFVYHAIGGEFNPDEKLKREMLWSFLHPKDNKRGGLFRLPLNPNQLKTLMNRVHELYVAGMPFDLDFNWQTNDRLYCAEFVVKSLIQALNDTSYFHHTFIMGKEGVAVDDVTTNKNVTSLGKWEY